MRWITLNKKITKTVDVLILFAILERVMESRLDRCQAVLHRADHSSLILHAQFSSSEILQPQNSVVETKQAK